jgi:hypothetical protein
MKRLLTITVSLLVAVTTTVGVAQSPAPQAGGTAGTIAPARQIVATYFHGDVRCYTCKKIEADARAAIEQAFATELADGRVVIKAVNIDREENAHFVTDYSLVTRSLVLTEEAGGKVVRWVNLDKVWQLVRNEDAYREYVVGNVRAWLNGKA